MPLPADILRAVAELEGGRISLVIGAGCSVEPPTNLPMARECARVAYERLVRDGVITGGSCADPDDLSLVADTVFAQRGSQRELVERLPINEFRLATPNEGHMIAAALLRERAIASITTLNFDLAMTTALASVSAGADVQVIEGPENHGQLGLVNLIYLHRNANAASELWILRTADLESAWRGGWIEAIVLRGLMTPITVFAGLGSVATVLVESSRRIRQMIRGGVQVFLVDPIAMEDSRFFMALELQAAAYVRAGWIDFMRQLADRAVQEHRAQIEAGCAEICRFEKWPVEDVSGVSTRMHELGLLGLGRVRARWFLDSSAYLPHRAYPVGLMAHLALIVRFIERTVGMVGRIAADGLIEFEREGQRIAAVILVTGRGVRSVLALEPEIQRAARDWKRRDLKPRIAVVVGAEGMPAVSAPDNIVAASDPSSIVGGDEVIRIVMAAEIRGNAALAQELVR